MSSHPIAPSDALPLGPEHLETATNGGERLGAIEFDFTDRKPASAKQNEFKLLFWQQMARLKKWAADRQWDAFSVAVPKFHVVVSGRYRISRSLVPAWSGRPGDMEFPLWRVTAGQAAIMHELVHVFFPNGNRFLAEGLAVYLQAEIGGNPAFPNFGRPLHDLACELTQEMMRGFSPRQDGGLERVHPFADLDRVATPNPLSLRIGENFYGEEPRGQACIYPLAGSFVQFLIETYGLDTFRSLYVRTPLVPFRQDAGTSDRWADVYGRSLDSIEGEWKTLITRTMTHEQIIQP